MRFCAVGVTSRRAKEGISAFCIAAWLPPFVSHRSISARGQGSFDGAFFVCFAFHAQRDQFPSRKQIQGCDGKTGARGLELPVTAALTAARSGYGVVASTRPSAFACRARIDLPVRHDGHGLKRVYQARHSRSSACRMQS